MRLRKGQRSRDLTDSKVIFVTTNRLFATSARRFLIRDGLIRPFNCPPVLHVGQVGTIAWLMKDRKLEKGRVGRDLLSNCYAAIRPDAEWFRFFREGVEKVVGDLDAYQQDTRNSLTIQAARRIAQEETFGNAALVRNLNSAELLSRAEKAANELLQNTIANEQKKSQAEQKVTAAAVREETRSARDTQDESRSRAVARKLRTSSEIVAISIFLLLTFLYDQSALFGGKGLILAALQVTFFVPSLLSLLDLFGIKLVGPIFEWIEHRYFLLTFRFISGKDFRP